MKKCDICSHSRAAHLDGIRCALCDCVSQERTFTQQALVFRSALAVRTTATTRKR